ncbi:MAG: hypothetical protein MJZ61_02195 [Bacteroidales bacterium]|nr:hypothetical protein [Bacteroidales bacterium]
MVPMVWDINACNRDGAKGIMTILDRANLKVFCEPAMEGIKEGVWSGRLGVILSLCINSNYQKHP